LLKDLNIFFFKKDKKNFYLDKEVVSKLMHLIPMSIFSSVLEILSISMLIPILAYFVEIDSFSSLSFAKIYGFIDAIFLSLSLEKSLLIILALFILKNIVLLIIAYYRHNVNMLITKNISEKLYTRYINLNFSSIFFLQTPTIIKNLTSEAMLYGRYLFSLIILITEAILLISILFFLFYVNFKITLSIVILLTISLLAFYLFSKKFVSNWSKQREYFENLRLKNLQEVFSGFMTVKIFQLEKTFIRDFVNKNSFYDYIKKERFVGETPRIFLEIFLLLTILIIILSMQFTSTDKKELFILISVFSIFFIRMIPSMNKILIAISSMKYCQNSVEVIINEIKKAESSKKNYENTNEKINEKFIYKEKMAFNNISFYFNVEKKFINNISFEIKKNQILGVSGPSGSGKSTLINIIVGLLKPKSGEIFLDNNLVNINTIGWRNLFSYVPQNIFIFEDTLKNNILLNNTDSGINDGEIFNLLKILKLDKIAKSENDLNLYLQENGKNLSGGEKQRIGFARALISKKPILILDEATNALDKKSQKEILDIVVSFKDKKTIIIISHDNEVMKICDNVLDLTN